VIKAYQSECKIPTFFNDTGLISLFRDILLLKEIEKVAQESMSSIRKNSKNHYFYGITPRDLTEKEQDMKLIEIEKDAKNLDKELGELIELEEKKEDYEEGLKIIIGEGENLTN
jgi:hypothetical protein